MKSHRLENINSWLLGCNLGTLATEKEKEKCLDLPWQSFVVIMFNINSWPPGRNLGTLAKKKRKTKSALIFLDNHLLLLWSISTVDCLVAILALSWGSTAAAAKVTRETGALALAILKLWVDPKFCWCMFYLSPACPRRSNIGHLTTPVSLAGVVAVAAAYKGI